MATTTDNVCIKNTNGTFKIVVEGIVVRKECRRAFQAAYVYPNEWVRFAPDSQLRRLFGEPRVIALATH